MTIDKFAIYQSPSLVLSSCSTALPTEGTPAGRKGSKETAPEVFGRFADSSLLLLPGHWPVSVLLCFSAGPRVEHDVLHPALSAQDHPESDQIDGRLRDFDHLPDLWSRPFHQHLHFNESANKPDDLS